MLEANDLALKGRFFLPEDYKCNSVPAYFEDVSELVTQLVYQPEVYQFALTLCEKKRFETIIDIGCGNAEKLMSFVANKIIGVDYGRNISMCRHNHGEKATWIEADLETIDPKLVSEHFSSNCLIICSDVVEHLLDPTNLLKLLSMAYHSSATVVTSTPDRVLVRGAEHHGPPPNTAHVREWSLAEYEKLLASFELDCTYIGYTLNNSKDKKLRTIISLHDGLVKKAETDLRGLLQEKPKPKAIISAYNEADIIEEVTRDFLNQGCAVHLMDNWSTDETYVIMLKLEREQPDLVSVERFPEDKPMFGEWASILKRKEEIATKEPGRWFIHTDADELRRSPFPNLNLAEGLFLCEKMGANRVSFNLINFRPVETVDIEAGPLMLKDLLYFEFGDRPGHFQQSKAWLQGSQQVNLASSGGHTVEFENVREFSYKFLLKHYPIRSSDHAVRKIERDRNQRFSPNEKNSLGWHAHYSQFDLSNPVGWSKADLFAKNDDFWLQHGLALISDLARTCYLDDTPRAPGDHAAYSRMKGKRVYG